MAASLTGCGSLPNGRRLIEGPLAQRAVARVIGGPLAEAANTVTPTGIDGQSFTYYGTAHGMRVTLVVFDNASATRFVLGKQTHRSTVGGLRVLRSRNIVLFYTAPPAGSNLSTSLQRALKNLG